MAPLITCVSGGYHITTEGDNDLLIDFGRVPRVDPDLNIVITWKEVDRRPKLGGENGSEA